MADVLYFSRDTKLYVEIGSNIWELPVLDGFSFSQNSNSTEVTLAEMESSAGVSRRGRAFFNDSLAPAEWSFSTYVRPFKSAGTGTGAVNTVVNSHHAVEEVLWALMAGDAAYASSSFTGFTRDTTDLNIDFDSSNKSTLGTANLYFKMGATNPVVYKLTGAVVNEATLDFDIDGLATINWSGFASTVSQGSAPTATLYEDITATDNFIRNRLTQLTITADDTTTFPGASNDGVYNLTLTGGSITISNNITFITPEELGVVNTPVGHVTGARTVSGNFTCYLNLDTVSNLGTSTDFFNDLTSSAAFEKITNKFATTFKVGGSSATPRLELSMATSHFEIPVHSIDDVISLETSFQGLPSTISDTDELALTYVGA